MQKSAELHRPTFRDRRKNKSGFEQGVGNPVEACVSNNRNIPKISR
jgi:hypothetical protein